MEIKILINLLTKKIQSITKNKFMIKIFKWIINKKFYLKSKTKNLIKNQLKMIFIKKTNSKIKNIFKMMII